MRKTRVVLVTLFARREDHREGKLASWKIENQIKRVFVAACIFSFSHQPQGTNDSFRVALGVFGMSTTLLSCSPNAVMQMALFWGKNTLWHWNSSNEG